MTEEEFSALAMPICLGIFILFLFFIIWQLGKESQAGKFGTIILFLVLGLGIFGFLFKNILIRLLM